MSRPLLALGAKGNYVFELQNLLNKWLIEREGADALTIDTDKDFGNITKETVKDFQYTKYLYSDGIVGKMTWAALLETERFNYFDIPTLIRAPDPYRCWAASGAMLLKRGSPLPRTPGVDFETQPSGVVGGIENSHANMQKFADYHDMSMVKAEHYSCLQLVTDIYRYGRLMLNIKGVNTDMKASKPEDSHLVVMIGARGDGEPHGTTITIYNPSNSGSKSSNSYHYLKSKYPKLTYQVFNTLHNRSNPI